MRSSWFWIVGMLAGAASAFGGEASLPPILYVARQQYAVDHHNTGTDFTAGDVSCQNVRIGSAIRRLDGTNVTTVLDCPRGVIRDLELSWDAKKLLFSMRREAWENFSVWEMDVDGGNLHRLTDGKFADIDPAYLPDGRIVFSSNRDVKYCGCNWHLQGNIFRMDADGSNIRQLGRNNLYESRPSVLPDGRIIYDRWEYVDRHFGPSFGLWTMFPDGRTQALFYGNNAWAPGAIFDARPLPGGHPERVVCIFGSCHDRPWGALVALDRRKGLDGMKPVLRSFPSDITNKVMVGASLKDGRSAFHPCEGFIDTFLSLPIKYEDPYPLDANRVLCARMIRAKDERTGIYLCDFATGEERLIREEQRLGCFDPIPLMARPVPPKLADAINESRKTGVFYVADVYHGTGMEAVPRGTIKYLRIVEAPPKRDRSDSFWNLDTTHRPAVNYNSTNTKRVLGVVRVEEDGSALFEVPSETFLYFQALDADGKMVQSMRSGTTVMPGERASCVGCHEDRLEATPPIVETRARRAAPQKLQTVDGLPPREFSYMHEIQPIWTRNCLACHDYGKPGAKAVNLAPDLGIIFNTSYLSLREKIALRWYPDAAGASKELLKPVDDGPPEVLPAYAWGAHRSRLIDLLDAGHHGVKLTAAERAKLIEWIDLNMPYYPTYETAFPDRPYGRSPLTFPEAEELVALTGCKESIVPPTKWYRPGKNGNRELGTGVNFTRPELSPCLKGLSGEAYERALAIIRTGAEALRRHGRPDLPDGTRRVRETPLKRLVPQGALADCAEVLFDLGRERTVAGLDFVTDGSSQPPRCIDVIDGEGKTLVADLSVPFAPNSVVTVGFEKAKASKIGFRVKEAAPGGSWRVKGVRVRIATFAGHLVLEETERY